MTQDEIIRMAREAGATPYTNRHYPDRPTYTFNVEQLKRFAELVAAAAKAEEREACAKAVEAEAYMFETLAAAKSLSAAIRARGNT